jgi:hypothetical protein
MDHTLNNNTHHIKKLVFFPWPLSIIIPIINIFILYYILISTSNPSSQYKIIPSLLLSLSLEDMKEWYKIMIPTIIMGQLRLHVHSFENSCVLFYFIFIFVCAYLPNYLFIYINFVSLRSNQKMSRQHH